MLVPSRSTHYLSFSTAHSFDSKADWSLTHFCWNSPSLVHHMLTTYTGLKNLKCQEKRLIGSQTILAKRGKKEVLHHQSSWSICQVFNQSSTKSYICFPRGTLFQDKQCHLCYLNRGKDFQTGSCRVIYWPYFYSICFANSLDSGTSNILIKPMDGSNLGQTVNTLEYKNRIQTIDQGSGLKSKRLNSI